MFRNTEEAILGAWGTLPILRGFELLFTGTLTAYGAGSLFGSFVVGPLLLFAAWKAFAHARKSSRAESQNNR